MLIDYWEFFLHFWANQSTLQIIRTFWYFFILEVPRFLLFDFLVVGSIVLNSKRITTRKNQARKLLWAEMPLVSIIVPGKNEGPHLYKLVNSLKEQTYFNYELIVVDDGSDDATPFIGRDLERAGMIDRFIRNDVRGGKASGANTALRYSKGKFIVHLDADTSFDRDSIENILLPFYIDESIGAVGGNIKVRNYKDSLVATLQAIEYLNTISMSRIVSTELGIYRIISGAFGAFRADVLKRLGGWDIGPGLDGDITVKFRKVGYRIHFEPSAIGLTNAPTTFKVLSKQRLRWSKSVVRFRVRKHIDVYKPQKNFNLLNLMSFLDNIIYDIVLNILWWVYLVDIIFSNVEILAVIIPLKIIMYMLMDFAQFSLLMAISERRKDEWKLIFYVPVMVFYNSYYMRFIRTMAYFKEYFFFSSYKDPWNPEKTSVKALQNKF
jgi:cellulose synthase/poly-beta-1,6-N-acetylglucosamine synthase-like glycosyltransferase